MQYDKDKNGNVDKNSVTLGGGDKGTNLKNVADGKVAEGSKDAVNGGQLWNVQIRSIRIRMILRTFRTTLTTFLMVKQV